MNNYKDLYKSIDNLKNKIKKLETNNKESKLESYIIFNPKSNNVNKKYIALLFDNNNNEYESESSNNINNLKSFITLKKGKLIINYSITIDLNEISKNKLIGFLSLGIKSKDSKIKIIKGSKYIFDLSNVSNIIDNKIYITNTIIYLSNNNEELCMIGQLNKNCIINHKKSLLKILSIN